jgi:hypothetical protein
MFGKEKIAAICLDTDKKQSMRLFSFPELKPSGCAPNLNLRSMVTLPSSVVQSIRNTAQIRRKNALVEQIRSNLLDSEQIAPLLKELSEKGYWAEAKLLQAENARVKDEPLNELGFLLQLTRFIRISQNTAPIFHRLALLLAHLNEPELALRRYEEIRTFLQRDDLTLDRLRKHPLLGLDPEKTARADISTSKKALQEMEKDTVLKRPFRWRLIIPSREPKVFKINFLNTLDSWAQYIEKEVTMKGRDIEMEKESSILFNGVTAKKTDWLRISQIGSRCPSPYLDYTMELDHEFGQARGYGIFNPNKNVIEIEDVAVHNATLAQAYRGIYVQRESANWLNEVHRAMNKLERNASYKRR